MVKHIYYFSFYGVASPTTRYRGLYPLQMLAEQQGITYDFITPGYSLQSILRFVRVLVSALLFRKQNSAIVFQKIYSHGIYATGLKMLLFFRRQNTLYDIDDAEYLRFSDRSIIHFMKRCSKVFVGSTCLSNYAAQYNNNVHLLTSPVVRSTIRKNARNNRLTIGWVGDYGTGKSISKSYSHKTSLETLLFPALLNTETPLLLILAGVNSVKDKTEIETYFSSNKNIHLEIPLNIEWNDDQAIQKLIASFDVGVSPMIDHEFNRAKSAFKLKQYFSSGVPVLASPIGENNAFLQEGLNGFFCSTAEEFSCAIAKLKEMSDLQYAVISNNAFLTTAKFEMTSFCAKMAGTLSTN